MRTVSKRNLIYSWAPRLRCLPGKSTSGCTTRICLVRASLRLNVFSSTHSAHRTFCFRTLCIVSSCRVRSYGREKTVLQGFPVVGLMRSHLCGPACELRAERAADVIPLPTPGVCCCWAATWRCPSRLCRCSFCGVSKRKLHPW